MDTVIVGGGIAGLTLAEELAKDNVCVTVLERYPAWGGRVVTHRENNLQYEIGAGRIFKDHARVLALIKRFNLHTYPITTSQQFERNPNPFIHTFRPIHTLLHTIPQSTLQTHTIAELIPTAYKPLLKAFPYWAEFHMMRADVAMKLFDPSDPMTSNKSADDTEPDFFGVKEGLDAITTGLANAAIKAGADLRNRHRVHDIQRRPDGLFLITGDYGKKVEAQPFTFTAKRVIIATCRCSLSRFSILKDTPLLKQLGTSPLLRIYAVYPPNSNSLPWFHDVEKQVTANPLRYVIPIDKSKGLIMISYTDGNDTNRWRHLDDQALEAEIQKQTKLLFPDKTIPPPSSIMKHDWPSGCTYWLPGNYDVKKASKAAMNPSPNLYIAGESISLTQTWIEGALESAETLLKKLRHST
jgi:2-polyprenyl-6-methoxyphenol hydroxylase-like FAD-dependent oxidoreductase